MNYSIIKTLVSNSDTEIFLAEYAKNSRTFPVLIKTGQLDISDPLVVKRLHIAKSFKHKSIPELVEFGTYGKSASRKNYYSTRHFPGILLTQVINRLDALHKKAPISFILHVILSLCDCLEYIYGFNDCTKKANRSFHGNICPDNILITFEGDICLVDSGIADISKFRFTGTELVNNTKTIFQHPGAVLGAPLKKSHEIHSLGMLLFCMLIEKSHFESFVSKNARHPGHSLPKYFPSIPEDLDTIINQAICYGSDRSRGEYKSFKDVANDLLTFSLLNSNSVEKESAGLVLYSLFSDSNFIPISFRIMYRDRAQEYLESGDDNALKSLLHFGMSKEAAFMQKKIQQIIAGETEKEILEMTGTPGNPVGSLIDEPSAAAAASPVKDKQTPVLNSSSGPEISSINRKSMSLRFTGTRRVSAISPGSFQIKGPSIHHYEAARHLNHPEQRRSESNSMDNEPAAIGTSRIMPPPQPAMKAYVPAARTELFPTDSIVKLISPPTIFDPIVTTDNTKGRPSSDETRESPNIVFDSFSGLMHDDSVFSADDRTCFTNLQTRRRDDDGNQG